MNDISHGLIRRLRDSQDGLPAAQRSVVGVILEAPRAAAGATVEQLAQASGVSMPTIVRTCRSFGYGSVREFMLALAQDVAVSGSYLHRSVLAEDGAADVASKIVQAALSSLAQLGRHIDAQMIDRVTDKRAQASRSDCYSVREPAT